jgi:hypothetical protein
LDWHTVGDAVAPTLNALAYDPAGLGGVAVLGLDEHIWHHARRPGKAPKELTGMVDLTERPDTKVQARMPARCSTLCRAVSGRPTQAGSTAAGRRFTNGV